MTWNSIEIVYKYSYHEFNSQVSHEKLVYNALPTNMFDMEKENEFE